MAKRTSKPTPPKSEVPLPSPPWRHSFRKRLLRWYDQTARDLPWRKTQDAYCVWVSEIMLQQTQVATVEPYFIRFLHRFPTVADLAAADLGDVLHAWEGLGYYRRARQMHRAAQEIVAHHGGKFPREPKAVRALPGIGRYTAGAILSIAFDAHEAILEANTIRLFARLLAYQGDPAKASGQALLWDFAEKLLPADRVGVFNQALMELGSLVCTPKDPACVTCPVAKLCPTRAQGLQAEIPRPKRPVQFESVREAALVISRRGRILLRQCGPDERWSGLWDFPRVPMQATNGRALRKDLRTKVEQLTGVSAELGEHLTTIKHGVTRFRITLECFRATYIASESSRDRCGEMKWIYPSQLDRYPLSSTGRKIAQLLASKRTP